jgi:hypothetical protein
MELNLLTLYVAVFLLPLFTHLSNHTGDIEHLHHVLGFPLFQAETIAYCHSGTGHGTTGSNGHVASSSDKTYGIFPNVINRGIVFVAQSIHNRSKNTEAEEIRRVIFKGSLSMFSSFGLEPCQENLTLILIKLRQPIGRL